MGPPSAAPAQRAYRVHVAGSECFAYYVLQVLTLSKIRSAASAVVAALRADQRVLQTFQERYGGNPSGAPLARDLVDKVGLQVMGAYRVMRFLSEIDAKVPARVTSRLIRHIYGSDIHWDADLEPGVMVVHGMGMAISRSARVGRDVILFQHCTLGEGRHPDTREVGAPTVEQGAVIGVGAVILGPITIGRGSKVMPGCVVTRSVPPNAVVEAPTPVVRARRLPPD
jgi:serine acetyltransferase